MCPRFGTLFLKIPKPRNHPKERIRIHNTAKVWNQDKSFVTTVGRLWLRLQVDNSLSHHWPWVQFAVYITRWTIRQFDPGTRRNLLQTNHTRSWTLQTVTSVTLISMFHCNSLSLLTGVYTSDCEALVICPEMDTLLYVLHVILSQKNVSNESDFKTPFLFKLFHLYRQVNRTLAYTSLFICVLIVVLSMYTYCCLRILRRGYPDWGLSVLFPRL